MVYMVKVFVSEQWDADSEKQPGAFLEEPFGITGFYPLVI